MLGESIDLHRLLVPLEDLKNILYKEYRSKSDTFWHRDSRLFLIISAVKNI